MPRNGYLQLPRSVLDDVELSDSAVRIYAILVDASRAGRANISVNRVGERLGRRRTKYAAMAGISQLVARGHIEVIRVGRLHNYHLIGCVPTTNPGNEEAAIGCPDTPIGLPNHNPIGGAETTLRKRTYLNSLAKDVRKAMRKPIDEPSDQLIEVLLDLGGEWTSAKIRTETGTIYKQIGGITNERAFIVELRKALANPKVQKPFGYALKKFTGSAH